MFICIAARLFVCIILRNFFLAANTRKNVSYKKLQANLVAKMYLNNFVIVYGSVNPPLGIAIIFSKLDKRTISIRQEWHLEYKVPRCFIKKNLVRKRAHY